MTWLYFSVILVVCMSHSETRYPQLPQEGQGREGGAVAVRMAWLGEEAQTEAGR